MLRKLCLWLARKCIDKHDPSTDKQAANQIRNAVIELYAAEKAAKELGLTVTFYTKNSYIHQHIHRVDVYRSKTETL